MRHAICSSLVLSLLAALGNAQSNNGEVTPAVPQAKTVAQREIAARFAEDEKKALQELAHANTMPASCKLPVRMKTVADPWTGFAELEQHGLRAGSHAKKGTVNELLDELLATLGKGPAVSAPL